MAYLTFDRKAVFTQEETRKVLKLTTKYYEMDMTLENMLFGLLDGYLYPELKGLVAEAGFEAADVLFIDSLLHKLPTQRYNLIEEGMIHTEDLTLSDAAEMLERYESTYPDINFWVEEAQNRK